MKVKLSVIVDGMEMQMEEAANFLNKTTGGVVFVTDDSIRYAEDYDSKELDDLPDWQKEQALLAAEVLNSKNYISLPGKYKINSYEIMEEFIEFKVPESLQFHLYNAIRGSGAFR